MNAIIIDNCIVIKVSETVIRITTFNLAKKMNPNLNIDSLPKITYGSRYEDNKIISKLASGMILFEDLNH